jgi:predicted DNA-binding transcriptional regulator YafY
MSDKKLFNILSIMKDLKNSKTICTKEYAKRFNVSIRTIQRYLEDISQFLQEEPIEVKRGCYKFLNFSKIKEHLLEPADREDFEKIAFFLNATDQKLLKYLGIDEKIIKKILKDDFLIIKSSPIEELMNFKLFKEVKRAIKYSQYIDVVYETTKKYEFENLRAYKMVFAQGNWYLAVHSDDELNNGLKFLRLNFIKSINVKKNTFKKDKEILEFLKTFQSLMSEFGAKKQEVIVFVDKEVQRYFKVKKFLSSQTILKETNDGLIIRYYITGENEILFLAKEWLPHMKILSPASLQDKLQNLINEFLKGKK